MPDRIFYDEQLLATAEYLLEKGEQNLAARHRAYSTAYYAVFHTLQFFIARSLLGQAVMEDSQAFEEIFRLLNHDIFKEKPAFFAAVNNDSEIIRIFENCFVLKEARIEADYKVPRLVKKTLEDCKAKVALARETVSIIHRVSQDHDKMRLLAVSLLIKKPKQR